MENKKQLIIIPPMSEAVKKLHEVLEGISADENMEITLIDDLKELGQFLGNTGQCLILVSNAKKCASFLQENRSFLMKNHCKTILFTPKEIPAKTLIKFTKIGLTESILENSPPKTFLYKVKLLLRSIKTAKPHDDADKTIKTLEQKAKEESELELKEKTGSAEENVIDMDRPSKKDQVEGETIDYGNTLKGKIKPSEENIDTHWKSDRNKSDVSADPEEEGNMAAESELSAIDMYYRGKSKKGQEAIAEEEDFDKKMLDIYAAEEEKKKKSSYADVVDEGTMKQKRLDQREAEEEINQKEVPVELDLIAAAPKKKLLVPEADEMDEFDKKMAELMALEAEGKKNKGFVEELGGHMKGNVASEVPEEEEEDVKEEKKYDNSDLEEEKPRSIELDLLSAAKKKDKKNIEGQEEDNVHDGEVDQIEGNMIGDEGTVEKIRTRMEGRSSYEEKEPDEQSGEDLFARKKNLAEEETSERDMLDLEPKAVSESKKREALRSDHDEQEMKQKSVELDLTPGAKKALEKRREEDALEERKKSVELQLEPGAREKKDLDKNAETESRSRDLDSGNTQNKKSDNQVHNSIVDKIDTFYRGGESAKKKDHDWGNLTDKKDSLDLLPGKGRRTDGSGPGAGKEDLGEQTIDYRKMKEEFDMINAGASSTEAAGSKAGNTALKNDEDEGSFKVQEIDPKSLDFSIIIINSIYQKDTKAKQIFALLAEELVNTYHCYPVFYTYKLSDKKFTEAFNPYVEIKDDRMNDDKRAQWNEFKKDAALFEHFQEKSMTTWRCPEIVNNNEVWEDVELPSWAENELKSKKVELIFPYFDGIDRMGMAVVLFPDGLDPQSASGLLTVLEMARSLFLDTIQRYQVQPVREEKSNEVTTAPAEEKKNVLSFFGGLFGKKKAG